MLDQIDKVSFGSRAICFAKRPLEILDRRGCGQALVDKGTAWNRGREVYDFDLLSEDGQRRRGTLRGDPPRATDRAWHRGPSWSRTARMCATTALPPLPQNPPVPDDPAAQTARLLIALRAISHELEVQSHRSDREIGLTLPQLLVLSHIRDFSAAADADEPAPSHALTGRGIAKAMALSAPTVVGILDNLEARGMIHRQRSVRDRRNIVPRLTQRAHQVLTDAPPLLGSDFAHRFAAMAPHDRAATIHAVDRVAALFRTLPDSA